MKGVDNVMVSPLPVIDGTVALSAAVMGITVVAALYDALGAAIGVNWQ
jgi:hypothetical protein